MLRALERYARVALRSIVAYRSRDLRPILRRNPDSLAARTLKAAAPVNLASIVLLVARLALPLPAPVGSDYDAARAELETAFVSELLRLAEEAADDRRFGRRDELLERVLVIEPDQRDARRTLRYRRRDGEWVRPDNWRPARDRAEGDPAADEAADREVFAPYRDGLLALVEAHTAERGEEWAVSVQEDLRDLMPEDAVLRELLGEVRVGGGWILEETQRARARRVAIAAIVEKALAEAPAPSKAQLDRTEDAAPIEWAAGAATDRVRTLGSVPATEVVRTARTAHAAGDVFEALLGTPAPYRRGFTIYLLDGRWQGMEFLRTWPGLSDAVREYLRPLRGGWIEAAIRVVDWSPTPEERLDGALRQTLGMFFESGLNIRAEQGWAWEGFGLYLTDRMLGTTLTWFVKGVDKAETRSSDSTTGVQDARDLLAAAYRSAAGGEAPRLRFMLGRSLGDMGPSDLVRAHALVAYLIEGHPDAVRPVLFRLGDSEHPVRVLEDELGMTLTRIEARLDRWLGEMTEAL